MLAMAAMFVVTIVLGIIIHPFHDNDATRAFGTEGASQARFVFLELTLIFVFTAAIIWLARKNMAWIIKGLITIVIFFALISTIVPLTYMAMVDEAPPFSLTDLEVENEPLALEPMDTQGNQLLWVNGTVQYSNLREGAIGTTGKVHWSTNVTTIQSAPRAVRGPTTIGLCGEGGWAILNSTTGDVRSSDFFRTEEENISRGGCTLAFEQGGNTILINRNLVIRLLYNDSRLDQICALPSSVALGGEDDESPGLTFWNFTGEVLTISDGRKMTSATFPESESEWSQLCGLGGFRGTPPPQPLEERWNITESITTAAIGLSPNASSQWWVNQSEHILILGHPDGRITGFELDEDGMLVRDTILRTDKGTFDGEIRSITFGDYNRGGWMDVFIVDETSMRMLSSSSFTEQVTSTISDDNKPLLTPWVNIQYINNSFWSDEGLNDGAIIVTNMQSWQSGTIHLPSVKPVMGPAYAFEIVAFVISLALMVWLLVRPDWHIVNIVGILVGAGVVTILGVSFVPWLIILFMVLAAIYDWWAVYKSKHMLDLAETMIDLKMPILLVAPQEQGYSMRSSDGPASLKDRHEIGITADGEGESEGEMIRGDSNDSASTEPQRSDGREALFMGLGDVIFPGMLVLSAITWLPHEPSWFNIDAALICGIGALIGGLVGYTALMSFVAMGRPQAGLPLLNGGAILGFLITVLLVLGPSGLALGGVSW